jgi:hypothetical protein
MTTDQPDPRFGVRMQARYAGEFLGRVLAQQVDDGVFDPDEVLSIEWHRLEPTDRT